MAKVLFEITDESLDTGLRGFPIGHCPTSYVDPEKGIFYVGKPIVQLADKKPEDVIYLLYHGSEGDEHQRKKFADDLKRRAACSKQLVDAIYKLPVAGHSMKLFSIALLLLGTHEGTGDYREDCLNLIAKIPHLVACVINHHAGWGRTKDPSPNLGYMENFSEMLLVPHANKKELTDVFRLFNILHYDHGGGNLSTFVGKAVASGLEDMFGSITSAMLALAGPRHGKANQDCLEFVKEVLKEVGEHATVHDVESLIRHRLENKKLVFGFGHAVLRVEDARATVFYDYAKKQYPKDHLVKTAFLLREAGPKVLKENPKIASPYPNIDAISGTLLAAAKFDYPDYFTLLFGLSRVVGIAIQIVYERCEARDGKGTPIVRPKYFYKPR